jgi:16S rRNA (guanine527-N7)-methyltransferase
LRHAPSRKTAYPDGFRAKLDERLEHFGLRLEDDHLAKLGQYYRLLSRWNNRINLTSLRLDDFPAESLDRLLIEPIQASGLVEDAPLQWFDLGSGSGSPAIPLKIIRPAAEAIWVESIGKKAAFLREAVRVVGASLVKVLTVRIENLPAYVRPETADLVTLRGVRVDASVKASVSMVLKPAGRLLLFGAATNDEIDGFSTVEVQQLTKPGDVIRVLVKR